MMDVMVDKAHKEAVAHELWVANLRAQIRADIQEELK
jgi:hypothetical protein